MKKIDLDALYALKVLLQEQNVSRSAKRLHLSQPAVSAILKKLRSAFDDPLFTRVGQKMVPTAQAEMLEAQLVRALSEIDNLVERNRPFNPGDTEFSVILGVTDYFLQLFLVEAINRLKPQAPLMQIDIHPLDLNKMTSQLANGELDLCISTMTRNAPSLRYETLYEERMVCIARRGHPRAGRRMTMDKFCRLEHLVVQSNRAAERIEQALMENGKSRQVGLILPDFHMVPSVVARSELIAVVAERIARRHADALEIYDLPFKLAPFVIAMFWHERTHTSAPHVWVRKEVGALARIMSR